MPVGDKTTPNATTSSTSTTKKPVWNVPFERNKFFTGRGDVLGQLETELQNGAVALSQAAAISGLGGIGKTQTAVEFAYLHQGDYDEVLWVGAESELTLVSGFAALAALLDLPEKDAAQQQLAVQAVQHWLLANHKWLLILDNADDLPLARRFVPRGVRGHVLYTTRSGATGQVAKKITLEKLSDEDGARLLLKRSGKPDTEDSPEWNDAKDISAEMGGLPLALEQAGAYVEENFLRLADYLELYRAEGVRLLEKHGALSNQDHNSVTVTFSIAFEQLAASNPAAAALLRLCALLASDDIPEEIFEKGAHELSDNPKGRWLDRFLVNLKLLMRQKDKSALGSILQSPSQRSELIGEVCRRSLLTRDASDHSLSIHRLVQAVLREEMTDAEKCQYIEGALLLLNWAFGEVEFENWPLCERLLPHALACLQFAAQLDIESESVAALNNRAAFYMKARAQSAAAEPLFERALAVWTKVWGPDHIKTATALNNLAGLYETQGKLSEAEPLYQRALAIDEEALGLEHPNTAIDLNNLAALYCAQGKVSEAEPLYKRALAILEKALGLEHPTTVTVRKNLDILRREMGQ
jgi:tetratricopeptide (TPR) repeat protein